MSEWNYLSGDTCFVWRVIGALGTARVESVQP